jgi:hypothetical protein
MHEPGVTKDNPSSGRTRRLKIVLVASLLAVTFICLLAKIALHTPWAASTFSRVATDFLGQNVAVDDITLTGRTLTLHGLVINAPAGFTARQLAAARTLSVTPDVLALLTGTRRLVSLEISDLHLACEKNTAGTWNFTDMVSRFSKEKERPSKDFLIGRLTLRDGNLTVNSQALGSIGFTATDFSTQGSQETQLVLMGTDSVGKQFRLVAGGRLGPTPSGHCTLKAPALALAPLIGQRQIPPAMDLGQATGHLSLAARLYGTTLTVQGNCSVDRIGLVIAGSTVPVKGRLAFSGRYSATAKQAVLDRAQLTINDRLRISGSALLSATATNSHFAIRLAPGSLSLGDMVSQLPEQIRQNMTLTGTATWPAAHLQGTRQSGLTAGSAGINLRDLSLSLRKTHILHQGSADFALSNTGRAWRLAGVLHSGTAPGKPLIEALEVPITAQLNNRLQPQRLQIPALKARILGALFSGQVTYDSAAATPLRATGTLAKTDLATLTRSIPSLAPVKITAGTAAAALRLQGTAPRHLSGNLNIDLDGLAATLQDKPVALRQARLQTDFKREAAGLSARGSVAALDGTIAGKACAATGDFSLVGRQLQLNKVHVQLDRSSMKLATTSIGLPEPKARQAGQTTALTLSLGGGEITSGAFALTGIEGHVHGSYDSTLPNRQLRGQGNLTIRSLAYGGHAAATLASTLNFTGKQVTAHISGTSLGGPVSSTITAALFSREPLVTWSALLRDQRLDLLAQLMPTKAKPRPTGGTMTARTTGTFSQAQGLSGALSLQGTKLAVANGGKTLLSGLNARAEATLAAGVLSLSEATIFQTNGPALQLHGSIARFSSPDRSGTITFTMPSTPLNSIIDTCVALLPTKFQEAVGVGTAALGGTVALRGGTARIQGALDVDAAGLELSTQKVYVTDITGRIPFSVVYPWLQGRHVAPTNEFNRSRHGQLRTALQQSVKSGSRLRIAGVRFGAMGIGPIDLSITADEGGIAINPVEVALYGGTLLGTSQLLLKPGSNYGADLLLDNLSLTQFCDAFPAIRGYISGRVDGIISLIGGGGSSGLTGYVQLWTRSGNGEKMLVSKEFLQKLAGKNLRGFMFSNDRAYDTGEIIAYLRGGYLTFEKLDISHRTIFGVKDLSVSVVAVQNRIALDHLLESIRAAATRGKNGTAEPAPVQTDLQWLE